jgi:hypothetical protein
MLAEEEDYVPRNQGWRMMVQWKECSDAMNATSSISASEPAQYDDNHAVKKNCLLEEIDTTSVSMQCGG